MENNNEFDFSKFSSVLEVYKDCSEILDINQVRNFCIAFDIVELIAQGIGASFSYKVWDGFSSCGVLNIDARQIDILDTELFMGAFQLADVVESINLGGGLVRLSFAFNQLTTVVL